jgi:hypothetical protein
MNMMRFEIEDGISQSAIWRVYRPTGRLADRNIETQVDYTRRGGD